MMDDFPSSQVMDSLRGACGQLLDTLRGIDDKVKARGVMMGRVIQIEDMANAYLKAMGEDCDNVRQGDRPDRDRIVKTEKKTGFIDKAHELEYGIGREVKELRTLMSNMPDADRAHVRPHVKALAEALDDCGICLNQTKGFAGKSTLPDSQGRVSTGIFKHLKRDADSEKKR